MRLDFLRRWLNEPLFRQLEETRRDLAVADSLLGRAREDVAAARAVSDTLQRQLTDTLTLLASLKRQGFAADPALQRPAVAPMGEDESQLWEAIWQRAPRGSGLAADLYQHAQQMLAADTPIEEVLGTILQGADTTVILDDEDMA